VPHPPLINQNGRSRLVLQVGDITLQECDAIVNAARPELTGGGGVDGAIHRAAGPALAAAGGELAPCSPGKAVLTPGFGLSAKWVIHTVGPVYRDGRSGEPETLRHAYVNSLHIARQSNFSCIAFPSISTGVYGYPIHLAAQVALDVIRSELRDLKTPLEVRMILFENDDFDAYRDALVGISQRST